MIVYFADRKLNIKGQASTNLPNGLTIISDTKIEDVDTGVAVFECTLSFDAKTRAKAEECAEVGNYILRSHNGENEFYTIIDSELDTKEQEIIVYAEDAGLDLLNEVVGAYAADKAYPITHYINKFAYDSGFVIKINEVSTLNRKLSWDGEATATERIASVATQFDGCEISYSFDIKGLDITNKYINIYKKRGQDNGVQLRLNKEVDRIITTKSIANLATALECVGGTPKGADKPITLSGYTFDNGDFYVSGTRLYSRKALQKWSRYQYAKEPNKTAAGGHIVRSFSFDTTSQSELCNRAVSELKSICDMEVNYDVDISKLDAKIGDRVNIVDDAGGLYLSTRILLLETSVTDGTKTATLGEHLIKKSGISAKVAELASQFAATAQTATRAYQLAEIAETAAQNAQAQADDALEGANDALEVAEQAQAQAETATQSAAQATEKANAAQAAVDVVEESVESLETTVQNAQQAADNAHTAATTAQTKADEAKTAADNAQTAADEAQAAATNAQNTADTAVEKADTAIDTADDAKTQAQQASQTATDAKADAQAAQDSIDALGDDLTTLSNTMSADYARKTELTEASASLQTQITQNADEIASHASQITVIDETANNAADVAAQATATAQQAKTQADAATADATAAQTAADEAKTAATNAQTEADNAKTAANNAKSVADQAALDLAQAEADLATVQGRVDATEADIIAAQTAVNEAKTAANNAKADADAAAEKAVTAQNTADTAVANASAAQTAADAAKDKATIAQAAAEQAQSDATAAHTKASEAATAAAQAQSTANTAKANAETANNAANEAAQAALDAQNAADDADAKVVQAQADLQTAQTNLANVTSRVDATEEEVEEAKAAVATAQQAAQTANQNAQAAQATANTAKADAEAAQTAADTAKTAADNAQTAADEAQAAAEKAQADVDDLAVRMTDAETSIQQNAEQIALRATKTEVEQTLGGYYTKAQTEALIEVESESITSTVSSQIEAIQVGGRNLILNSAEETSGKATVYRPLISDYGVNMLTPVGTAVTMSFDIKSDIAGAKYQFYITDTAYYALSSVITSTATTEWTRVTITRPIYDNTSANATGIPKYFTIRWNSSVSGYNADATISIKNVKVELGNKATDWTPAPEDLEDATAQAQGTANTATSKAEANAGRITTAESTLKQLADMISTLVTDGDGASLMTQTADGWTFSMGALIDMLDKNAQGLSDMSDEMGSINNDIESLKMGVADLGELANYVRINTLGEYPLLELGKGDSVIKLQLTNEIVQFIEGVNIPGKITKDGLEFGKGKFEHEMQVSKIAWAERTNANGGINVGLMWKGDEL